MLDSSKGVSAKWKQSALQVLAWTAMVGAIGSAYALFKALVSPSQAWTWVACLGWTIGFAGIWIATHPRPARLREPAADAIAAIAAAAVTLLGLLVEAPEIAGPLLSGLAILALGLWVLRRVVGAERDREERRRHDEIMTALKRLHSGQDQVAREIHG